MLESLSFGSTDGDRSLSFSFNTLRGVLSGLGRLNAGTFLGGTCKGDVDLGGLGKSLANSCGTSSLFSGSVGNVNFPNRLGGVTELGGSGNLGIPGGGFNSGPSGPLAPGLPRPLTLGIFGSCNPGGMTGVMPAMGLLTLGIGSPFFSASSICCNRGG